jgi:SAM-dependent methyltransferase
MSWLSPFARRGIFRRGEARKDLDQIGLEHGTDKASGRHGYLEVYDRHLSRFRDSKVRVLELGVFKGASLRMWRDYFPRGQVIGCDLHPDRRDHAGDRIAIEIGDCGSAAFLENVARSHGPFDVIVDDASHIWRHQQIAFETLFPHLKPGGIFIIEDIHTSGMERYERGLGGPTTVEWLKAAVDHVVGMPYDQEVQTDRVALKRWRRGVAEMTFLRHSCVVRKAT